MVLTEGITAKNSKKLTLAKLKLLFRKVPIRKKLKKMFR